MKKLLNWWYRRKTKNLTKIPLFVVYFNYLKYKNQKYHGKCNCVVHIHPDIAEDDELRAKINDCIDYIRDKYDMDIFAEVFHG